jgi:hypothetical protein
MTAEIRERIIRAIGLIEGVGCCIDRNASMGLEIACEYLNEALNCMEEHPVVPARQEDENDA